MSLFDPEMTRVPCAQYNALMEVNYRAERVVRAVRRPWLLLERINELRKAIRGFDRRHTHPPHPDRTRFEMEMHSLPQWRERQRAGAEKFGWRDIDWTTPESTELGLRLFTMDHLDDENVTPPWLIRSLVNG